MRLLTGARKEPAYAAHASANARRYSPTGTVARPPSCGFSASPRRRSEEARRCAVRGSSPSSPNQTNPPSRWSVSPVIVPAAWSSRSRSAAAGGSHTVTSSSPATTARSSRPSHERFSQTTTDDVVDSPLLILPPPPLSLEPKPRARSARLGLDPLVVAAQRDRATPDVAVVDRLETVALPALGSHLEPREIDVRERPQELVPLAAVRKHELARTIGPPTPTGAASDRARRGPPQRQVRERTHRRPGVDDRPPRRAAQRVRLRPSRVRPGRHRS